MTDALNRVVYLDQVTKPFFPSASKGCHGGIPDSQALGMLVSGGRSLKGPSMGLVHQGQCQRWSQTLTATVCVRREDLGPQAEARGPRAGKRDAGAGAGGGLGQRLGCRTL